MNGFMGDHVTQANGHQSNNPLIHQSVFCLVVPRGNAPRSLAYQASALLLSYRTMAEGVGNAPTSARADPVFKTGAASLYLPAFLTKVDRGRVDG